MSLLVGGSGSVHDITDLPNRRIIDEAIYYGDWILVGDGDGTELAAQEYLLKRDYDPVTVYPSGDRAKHNVGGWEVEKIAFDPRLTESERFRIRDIKMALECDRAVMAWDGTSPGTRRNIIDLMARGNHVHNMTWTCERDEWYFLDGSVDPAFLFGKGCYDRPLRLWLDDLRPAPEGYTLCRSVNEAKLYIGTAERFGIPVEIVDCDHDLGVYSQLGGDGIKLLDWLAERGTFYPVRLHTMNPVGRDNMQRLIDRYWGKE